MTTEAIRYEIDGDNIVTLTMDMPGQSANTMNAGYRAAMDETVERLFKEQDNIAGIILTSAKKTFFAGGDLNELIQVTEENAPEFHNMVEGLKRQLRAIETLGKPVVAAINGAALGGGWEIALACHHRICLADERIQLGLPEVTLGLLPGGGGIARTVRMLGLEKAFPLLIEGKKLRPSAALKMGLIHDTADSIDEMISKAKAWIKANPKSQQPFDVKGYKIPGGNANNPKTAQMLAIAPSMVTDKTKGCYPAPEAIVAAAAEGALVDFETACTIESRYFTQLAKGQVAKNMIGTFFFQLNDVNAGKSRPQGIAKTTFKKVGIIGAGMMGAGIAYSSAIRGLDVVLKDISQEAADKGKAYSEKLLTKQVSRKRKTEEEKQEILSRITATADHNDFAGCDLIIEAVFEDRGLKAKVTQEAESVLAEGTIISSNTSTLPITGLAEAVGDPTKFVGLHFFSPVDKMPLVEIIKGEQTSDETLAHAFDFVQQIKKTPIVVNDSRGFFTSRVFATYVTEGAALVGEGVNPRRIDMEAQKAGMPVGPLTVTDEVTLTLMQHIRNQAKADMEAGVGDDIISLEHPGFYVVDQMVNEFDRKGRASGAGFYDYPEKGNKHLWPGLKEHFYKDQGDADISNQDIQDRLLYIQAIETLRCLDENVLTNIADGNIGSIFGLGFSPAMGGALQFINHVGTRKFTERARELTKRFGERFEPPASLVKLAETNAPLV
ncbi:3-hydroxyacyl-CoA dehydrogenase NAD-binding domain-containing protein [Litoribrevibacter albus]|uniref:3-hydroxyacyl-CoA dehydrogenase n=1 Tax=Litoribrevibacter albus TaxID=1473156 RepID=A0AA37SAU0_9GAMM|nr:3-hydroxyacyl-CoA dehydrogenase NAD-binding domain-containing protein [Litoribrevibacter albus]GLQ32430.1 3-hydroxyacyl-CoA dehydrogenase [Litoribrevibacter albus]